MTPKIYRITGAVICIYLLSVLAGLLFVSFRAMPAVHRYTCPEHDPYIEKSVDTQYQGSISPNTAGVEELITIPGIGEKTAQAIIDERVLNGPYYYLADLTAAKGIGPVKLEQFSPYFCLP